MVSVRQGDEKIGGNGVERTFNKAMTNDGMTFEGYKHIAKPLSKRVIERAQREKVRVCAYGEVFTEQLTGWGEPRHA